MWADLPYAIYIILGVAILMMFVSGRFRGVVYEFWDHVAPLLLKWGWVYVLIGAVFVLMSNGALERIIHATHGP